jgi:hypothetical protein
VKLKGIVPTNREMEVLRKFPGEATKVKNK